MKRFKALLLSCLILIAMSACNTASQVPGSPDTTPALAEDAVPSEPADSADKDTDNRPDAPARKHLNVYSASYDSFRIVEKYKELHPEFPYDLKFNTFATMDGDFHVALDECLKANNDLTPDIYFIKSVQVKRYVEGEQSHYALPYKELGIDVDNLIKEADIPQYVIDMGTNAEGQIVALGYEGTGGAFIYRRSIAKDVWGTDDPEIIKDKIGPGWDKFLEAAAQLKARGYGILSSYEDIWPPVIGSAEVPWVVDGKLTIDPKREAFLDLAKQLHDNGYTNNTEPWMGEWVADMMDAGGKKIFGYFGPSWFVNYVLNLKGACGGEKLGEGTYGDWAVCEPPMGFFWGGEWVFVNKNSPLKEELGDLIKWITLDSSETGFQYFLANGLFDDGIRNAVTSGAVMQKVSGTSDFVGYQDMFQVFGKAAKLANGKNITQYDEFINAYFREQVREYAEGRKTRKQAITDFKQAVMDNLGIDVE
ncbi:MAG TPA: ABC transporter substrate-binding protein [Thermoclostridium caenicola]|uniref:ABC transporter substrate-binding protein n=1 Tax=Thermoclostridium caenicola TaxID=659425 RepID=UPI002C7FE05B|nr:ABC transporter substrate-binding protein [Thermoclostridium caenicola]HOK43114.1 ABC transporter substrate-binding protein [Thermoclostridium caenicola]HOL85122.1 ABC transporter substrate-binding protein [Thermoclostridium caenicola]HPO76344.1 ABC transporter substrate-binding protein [Thermoclostridium caenicola]